MIDLWASVEPPGRRGATSGRVLRERSDQRGEAERSDVRWFFSLWTAVTVPVPGEPVALSSG